MSIGDKCSCSSLLALHHVDGSCEPFQANDTGGLLNKILTLLSNPVVQFLLYEIARPKNTTCAQHHTALLSVSAGSLTCLILPS